MIKNFKSYCRAYQICNRVIDSKYHYVYRITDTVNNKHYYGSR